PLAIQLNIPVDTARRAKPAVSKLKALSLRRADYLEPVCRKVSENSFLQLRKCRDVEIDIVIEQANAAANYGAAVDQGKKSKANTWRKIIFARHVIAVEASAILECQSPIDGPLVLKVSEEFSLVPAELTAAEKIELLASRSIRSQNANRVVSVASV